MTRATPATGYALALPRPEVVQVSLRWEACGATVLVCEAEPIAELVSLGWHTYEVTHLGRRGAKPEWVTMNRPAQTRQASLFLGQRKSEGGSGATGVQPAGGAQW